MPITILHAADLHLDTPFEGLSTQDPTLAARLRDASLDAFDALVAAALAREVDVVLLAGDVYDGADRGVRAQLRLLAGLRRMSDAGIRTFIAHGNHDPVDEGWSALRAWPEGVHVFAADRAESVAFEVRGQAITVHGTSYPRRSQRESLLPRFPKPEGPGLHVGVLHANVGASPGHEAYSPCTVEALRRHGYHLWALGHVHTAQVLATDPYIAYPGNLQGRSFKPSERGPKGCDLLVVDGVHVTRTPLDLAPLRFHELVVDVGDVLDLDALARRLADDARALRAPARTALVRAVLTGRSELAADLQRDDTVQDLLVQLRDAAPADVVWLDLRDESAPPIDLEAVRSGDTLASEVLRAADEADPRAILAAHKDRAALEPLFALDDDALRALLHRAALRALSSLDEDRP